MPVLPNPRWEQFAQQLAKPQPPSALAAYQAAGYAPNSSHASRLAAEPTVAARIAELQVAAGKALVAAQARAEARVVAKIAITRQSLIEDTAAAYKLAEQQAQPQAMIQAVRLLAELALISLKAPEDKPAPQQHLHLHAEALVDAPPRETLAEWTQRKQQELEQRSTKQPIKLVATKTQQEEK